MNNQYQSRGDVYEGNSKNSRYRNNNDNNNNVYRQNNTFYNRNFQKRDDRNNNNHQNNSRPPHAIPKRFNNNRSRSHSGSKQQQQKQQQRTSRPRQLRLNDFMPPKLRDNSGSNVPRLPRSFNLADSDYTGTTNTRSTTPSSGFRQQPNNFTTQTITKNDTTQPFNVNNDDDDDSSNLNRHEQQQQEQRTTTTSYRRRQRRNRQKQYNYTTDNRFAELSEKDAHTDSESNDDAVQSITVENNDYYNDTNKKKRKNGQNKKKKKQPIYLEPTRILRYMQDNASNVIGARGNQAYVLATTAIYDEWVRDNYDLQVWQIYLKMGTENKHWAKDVVKRTKRRDDLVNNRFVQKKINQLTTNIAQANAAISNLQIQLATYWSQTVAGTAISSSTTNINTNTSTNRIRESTERLERIILKYIHQCTQHVKTLAENKIELAKAQMTEYQALQDFETIATPIQWNIHSMLKPKIKLWHTKNKNYRIATKRVEYDLPPNFISKINFTFKIDETILSKDESQSLYNDIRQLTKEYRVQAMSLYLRSITREREIVTNEIDRLIEGFPKENTNDYDDANSFVLFKNYHDLRIRRFELEAEQSSYFLVKQRVEGDVKEQEEEQIEIVAPTLTRSLGEDFLLQR